MDGGNSIYRSGRYECIVLDLDGSLIHASDENFGDGIEISFINSMGEKENTWVHKRPGLDKFLETCFEHSVVGVWSRGKAGYVEGVVGLFPEKPMFIYNRDNCSGGNGNGKKKLKKIPYRGSIVMIDDRSDVLRKTDRVDTIIIPKWHPKQKTVDTILYNLLPLLFSEEEKVSYSSDDDNDRCVIKYKDGKRIICCSKTESDNEGVYGYTDSDTESNVEIKDSEGVYGYTDSDLGIDDEKEYIYTSSEDEKNIDRNRDED